VSGRHIGASVARAGTGLCYAPDCLLWLVGCLVLAIEGLLKTLFVLLSMLAVRHPCYNTAKRCPLERIATDSYPLRTHAQANVNACAMSAGSSSCCRRVLEAWASTWPLLTLSSCTTATGTHRWTCRWGPAVGYEGCKLTVCSVVWRLTKTTTTRHTACACYLIILCQHHPPEAIGVLSCPTAMKHPQVLHVAVSLFRLFL
jgi:hypothetical protein